MGPKACWRYAMPNDPGTIEPNGVDGISTLATFDGVSSSARIQDLCGIIQLRKPSEGLAIFGCHVKIQRDKKKIITILIIIKTL